MKQKFRPSDGVQCDAIESMSITIWPVQPPVSTPQVPRTERVHVSQNDTALLHANVIAPAFSQLNPTDARLIAQPPRSARVASCFKMNGYVIRPFFASVDGESGPSHRRYDDIHALHSHRTPFCRCEGPAEMHCRPVSSPPLEVDIRVP